MLKLFVIIKLKNIEKAYQERNYKLINSLKNNYAFKIYSVKIILKELKKDYCGKLSTFLLMEMSNNLNKNKIIDILEIIVKEKDIKNFEIFCHKGLMTDEDFFIYILRKDYKIKKLFIFNFFKYGFKFERKLFPFRVYEILFKLLGSQTIPIDSINENSENLKEVIKITFEYKYPECEEIFNGLVDEYSSLNLDKFKYRTINIPSFKEVYSEYIELMFFEPMFKTKFQYSGNSLFLENHYNSLKIKYKKDKFIKACSDE